MSEILNNVKIKRLDKKITQRDLAKMAGLSETTIVNVERNVYTAKIGTLQKIANALEVNIKDLFKELCESDEKEIYTYSILKYLNKLK